MINKCDKQAAHASIMPDRVKVVLLEGNPDDVNLIQNYLASVPSPKFTIATFETLPETIDYLANNRADIVLSCLDHPDHQGMDALDSLLIVAPSVPIIILSSFSDESLGINAVHRGAQDYLAKDTLDAISLRRTIIYCIQRFQTTRIADHQHEIDRLLQAETATQASETLFRNVIDHSLAGIYLYLSQSERFMYVNPAFAEVFGYHPEEIIDTMRPVDLVVPAERPLVEGNIQRRIDGELDALRYSFTGLRNDGSTIHCEILSKRIDYDGQPAIIGTLIDITDHKRVEKAEHEQRTLAETLRETITNLITHLDIDQVMEQILTNIGNIVPHDTANIMMIEGHEAYIAYCRGYSVEEEKATRAHRFPLMTDSLHQIMSTGQPFMIEDTVRYPDWMSATNRVRCYLGAPIKVANQVIGIINLNSATPGFFTNEHIENVKIFADQAAIAVQNAQLFGEISDYAAKMAKLQRANGVLFTSLSTAQGIAEFGSQLTETAVEAFELVDCGIMLVDEENAEFKRLARAGQYQSTVLSPLYLDGPGLVPEAVRTRRTIYVQDVTEDRRYVPNIDSTRSELVIPLMNMGDKIIGVIDLQSSEVNAFSPRDQQTLKAFADRAAIAIENMRLNDAIRLYATGLEERMVERTSQLERLNHRMSAILNSTSDSIILTDADGLVDITNLAADQQFGYRPDELFGQPLTVIADQPYRDKLEAAREEILIKGGTWQMETLALRKDGTTFEAEIALSRVKSDELNVVCSLHDISHLKAVERMKDEFISTVSHELRTPIAAIVLLTEALDKYYDRMTAEQILKRVDQLRTQSNVLSEMVESILDISKLEMQERQSSMRLVNLSNVVRDIVGELQPSAHAKQQTIEFAKNDETAVIVLGEQMDFARIWRNLINNAIKYTPEGGDIYIRMERFRNSGVIGSSPPRLAGWSSVLPMLDMTHHDYVVGQVEDTGYGIRSDDFDGLFKRFDRGWAKESNIPGTGLGLPMVRELLATYGGDMHVSSQLDQGSIFTFWIPIEYEVNS